MARTFLTNNYEPGFPLEWEGLDVASAKDATPKWYGVGVGNGNDGVSHSRPAFYCRTNNPWTLAAATVIHDFKPSFRAAAQEAMEIEGESEFVISATIYNPEDVDPAEAPDPIYLNSYICPECGHAWTNEDSDEGSTMDCTNCSNEGVEPDESEMQERDGDDTYNSANGAWLCVEVFPVSSPHEWNDRSSAPRYDSLDECFDADVLTLAREE